MKHDIIVLGGAVIDVFLDSGISERNGNLCLPVGAKLLIKDLHFSTGGGGTNVSVAFSKLGLKTGLIGRVGKDENGKIILRELERDKVEWLGKEGDEPTGFSVIIDSKQKNRTILVSKEANNHVNFSDISLKEVNSDWIYLCSAVDETFQAEKKIADWAFRKGMKIAYNPSYYLTKRGGNFLKDLLSKVYVLILNEEEAENLVGKNNLFEKLHSLGPRVVCVTREDKGSWISDGEFFYDVKAHKVKVAEETGAGDAYASGFVFGFMKFGDVQTAAKIATLNAESVIQKVGAKNGLLTYSEIIKLLKTRSVEISKKLLK